MILRLLGVGGGTDGRLSKKIGAEVIVTFFRVEKNYP